MKKDHRINVREFETEINSLHLAIGLGHHIVHLISSLNSYSSLNWIGAAVLDSVLCRISPSIHASLTFFLGFLRFALVDFLIFSGIALGTWNGWPGLHCWSFFEYVSSCLVSTMEAGFFNYNANQREEWNPLKVGAKIVDFFLQWITYKFVTTLRNSFKNVGPLSTENLRRREIFPWFLNYFRYFNTIYGRPRWDEKKYLRISGVEIVRVIYWLGSQNDHVMEMTWLKNHLSREDKCFFLYMVKTFLTMGSSCELLSGT